MVQRNLSKEQKNMISKLLTASALIGTLILPNVGWGSGKSAKAQEVAPEPIPVSYNLYYDTDGTGTVTGADQPAKAYPFKIKVVNKDGDIVQFSGQTDNLGSTGTIGLVNCTCTVTLLWDDQSLTDTREPHQGGLNRGVIAKGLFKQYLPVILKSMMRTGMLALGPEVPVLPASANEPNPQRMPAYIVFYMYYDTDRNGSVSEGDLPAAFYSADVYFTDAEGQLYAMEADSNGNGAVDTKYEDCTCYGKIIAGTTIREFMLMPGDAKIIKLLVPHRTFMPVVIS
jgi:hypothetical protein